MYDHLTPIADMTLVYHTPGVNMLNNRNDLTVVWDLRVHPNYQSQGIGTELFKLAFEWAKKRECKQIKVETQNNNVKDCKYYAKQGYVLDEVNKYAYLNL